MTDTCRSCSYCSCYSYCILGECWLVNAFAITICAVSVESAGIEPSVYVIMTLWICIMFWWGRVKLELCQKTVSLWSWMNRSQELERFLNPLYEANSLVIWPSVAPQSLLLWEGEDTDLILHAFNFFWHSTYYILILPVSFWFFFLFFCLFSSFYYFCLVSSLAPSIHSPGSVRLLYNTDCFNFTIIKISFFSTILPPC